MFPTQLFHAACASHLRRRKAKTTPHKTAPMKVLIKVVGVVCTKWGTLKRTTINSSKKLRIRLKITALPTSPLPPITGSRKANTIP